MFHPLNIPENGKSSHMISVLRQLDYQDLSKVSKISCVYQTIFWSKNPRKIWKEQWWENITDKHRSIKPKEKREKLTSCRNVTWHVSRSRRQDDQWRESWRISLYRWSSIASLLQINHCGKCTKAAKFDTRWSNSLIWLVWQDQLQNKLYCAAKDWWHWNSTKSYDRFLDNIATWDTARTTVNLDSFEIPYVEELMDLWWNYGNVDVPTIWMWQQQTVESHSSAGKARESFDTVLRV